MVYSVLNKLSLMQKNLRFEGWKKLPSGKVRDRYITLDGDLVLVATDRVSAFDQVLGTIPGKGEVTSGMSAFWFHQTKDIIRNHMISMSGPAMMLCKKLTPIPVEVVVRGYMTGVTGTSIWGSYEKGERTIYGLRFRDGYIKNDKLDNPIITPTTKAEHGHDERLTEKEIVTRKVVPRNVWKKVRTAALAMFTRAQEIALQKGYVLVDTKMEFGMDEKGRVYIMDELFTPDSSRYWLAKTAHDHIRQGREPENYDKEYLRIELKKLKEKGVWKEGEPIPEDVRKETARRYAVIGETFHLEEEKRTPLVVIIMGSKSDLPHAQEIAETLKQFDVACEFRVASAHKNPQDVINILHIYDADATKQIIYIAVAGRSNALGGMLDGATVAPVISCPPKGEWYDLFSSVRLPSGIVAPLIMDPESAGLLAVKMFGLSHLKLIQKYGDFQEGMRQNLRKVDEKVRLLTK